MNKFSKMFAITFLFGAIAVIPVHAEEAMEAMKAAEPAVEAVADAAMEAMVASGEVVSVDAEKSSVTVKGGDAEWSFAVSPETKIAAGEEVKALGDLKAGDAVAVEYSKNEDGSLSATAISIGQAPAVEATETK